ncbi:MAG: hypothetical protein ACKJSG_06610 [Lentisphaeria bacterium]
MPKSQYTSLGEMKKSSFFYTRIALFVERLEDRESLPELQPGSAWDTDLTDEITECSPIDLFMPVEVKNEKAAQAVKAGVLLWNDELSLSHDICQGLKTPESSYIHGVMHRREGDYSNAKHWFAKAKNHPVATKLFEKSTQIGDDIVPATDQLSHYSSDLKGIGHWSPDSFVDWCESASQGNVDSTCLYFFKKLQIEEIRLLIDHCYQLSIGRPGS